MNPLTKKPFGGGFLFSFPKLRYASSVKNFTRTIEDFTCEHCGAEVKGDGYTNHCPACLWSKHVDKNPGDRAEACGGMMKPEQVELVEKEYVLIQKCVKCQFIRRAKLRPEDSFEEAVKIQKKFTEVK